MIKKLPADILESMEAKVHIAFGFHVNLYHSFRGDSNDSRGFGPDIRIIRNTLRVLDACNERGVKVKGTWDFENAYSLENILPVHAPDIIEAVARRIGSGRDEALLMSYNNGLVSCMDEREFTVSTGWAVSNPFGSGTKDLFGSCAPVVRPQEMMFSPSNIHLYKRLGIEAVCLYYSGVPFDSFRTLLPLLPEEDAYNPLWYCYQGEKLALIPAITHSDLVDYGCLGSLVKRLHKKQLRAEINRDVLIFINMDADAPLWYGLDLPFPLSRVPNARGLEGLIGEVEGLPYVVFDTPYNYLKSHPPESAVSFSQDTADGVFDGYASWAEKPFNHLIWSHIERARLLDKRTRWLADLTDGAKKPEETERLLSLSFHERLRLMSTTHFGLAAPMINRDREKRALETSARMLGNSEKAWLETKKAWLGTTPRPAHRAYPAPAGADAGSDVQRLATIPVIVDSNPDIPYISMSLSLKKGLVSSTGCLFLYDGDGNPVEGAFLDTARHEDASFAEIQIFAFPAGVGIGRLDLVVGDCDGARPYNCKLLVNEKRLSGEDIEVLCDGAAIMEIRAFGEKIGGKDFFRSYIKYLHGVIAGEHEFHTDHRELLSPGRGGKLAGYRLHGRIDLPDQVKPGGFSADIFIVDGIPALMVRMDIQYPRTPENDLISNEVAVLGHYYDSSWVETAPLQIKPLFSQPASVIKYNYQGDLSSYAITDFGKADPANSVMDSFNNHVTAGFTGVTDGHIGIIAAADRSRLSSMAFCPMRTVRAWYGPAVCLNPFGTYFGKQRHHRTYSGGLAQRLAVAASPYHRSLAPAYNGVRTSFMLGIFPFRGQIPEAPVFNSVKAFCDGCGGFVPPNGYASECMKDNVELYRGKKEGRRTPAPDGSRSLADGIPLKLRMNVFWNMVKTWFLSL